MKKWQNQLQIHYFLTENYHYYKYVREKSKELTYGNPIKRGRLQRPY